MKQVNGQNAWRSSEEINSDAVEEILIKIDRGDDFKKERIAKAIDKFGSSLKILNADSLAVKEHLEHLSFLPENFIELMKIKGLKVKIGDADVIDLSNDERLRTNQPRGWEGKSVGWQGVPGMYYTAESTVYAGNGFHGNGSRSLALHEYGHGVGDKLGLDNSQDAIDAHARLYEKLLPYLQQDGPGGFAGRQELIAESFAEVLTMPKAEFVNKYDEAWHMFLIKTINQKIVS